MEQSIFFATTTPILLSAVTHISLPCCNHILRLPFHHNCFWETAFAYRYIEYAHLLWNVIWPIDDDVLGCEEDSGEKKWQYPPEIRNCSFACLSEEEMWARRGHGMSPPTTSWFVSRGTNRFLLVLMGLRSWLKCLSKTIQVPTIRQANKYQMHIDVRCLINSISFRKC